MIGLTSDRADPGAALVTGASSGIGRAFARQLASAGHPVVLVARSVQRLEALAVELRERYGVDVEIVAADLADAVGRTRVRARLTDPDKPVDILVNNAGDTLPGSLLDADLVSLRKHLSLNVGAVSTLALTALPEMLARDNGVVVNVSSVNCFVAMPGAPAVYGAGKLFLTVASETMAGEVRGSAVHVMALCPGLTRTEFGQQLQEPVPAGEPKPTKQEDGVGRHWRRTAWSADAVARRALSDVARGRVVCVPGVRFRLTALLGRLLPYRPLGTVPTLLRRQSAEGLLVPGARAVVVGAGTSVGQAFCNRLAADGVDVVAVDADPSRLTPLRGGPAERGVQVETLVLDHRSPTGRAALRALFTSDDGRPVDMLVWAGAPVPPTGGEPPDPESRWAAVEAELLALLEVSQAALHGMRRRDRGALIHSGDITAVLPGGHGPDAMAAGAQAFAVALLQGLAVELSATDVRVMAAVAQSGATAADRVLADLVQGRVISISGRRRLLGAAAKCLPRGFWRHGAARHVVRRFAAVGPAREEAGT
jgi:uncharacterized protein